MSRTLANLAVVVISAILGYAGVLVLEGCGSWLSSYEEVNDPKDNASFERCGVLARAEKQISGDPYRAEAVYFACTDDAGLPRPVHK